MSKHVRLQLTCSHAWACTCVRIEMERKTLDCVCCNPGVILIHDSFTGWLRPYQSLFIDPNQMAASILQILIIIHSVNGWLRPYHIHHVFELSYCISPCRFLAAVGYDLVKHFTSLFLEAHALGGICYAVICHRPCRTPTVTHWRTHLRTCDQ